MKTTGINQAPHMHYMQRGARHRTPYVQPGQPLLPREIFEGRTELLEQYDRMVSLTEAMKHHQAEQARLGAEATAAEQAYHRNVREAMATGQDATKVENQQPRLQAEAKAHGQFHDEAKKGAVACGHALGELIAEAAPTLFADSEATMATSAAEVTKAVAHLRKTWAVWSSAWSVRVVLGSAHLLGGQLGGYRGNAPLPEEVAAALATLEDHLKSLDRLKSDEANIAAFRQADEVAAVGNTNRARLSA